MSVLADLISVAVISGMIGSAVPIVLPAIGASYSEGSGIINIGLEGMGLMGAWSAVAVSYFIGSPWLGLLVAALVGGLMSLILAFLSVIYNANQILVGVGINLLAAALTRFLTWLIWGSKGTSATVPSLPNIEIPIISQIPFLGPIIGQQNVMAYIMFSIIVIGHIVLFKTSFGLRLRSCGEHPEASESAGIDVYKMRFIGVFISGTLAGLGGAYLSIGLGSRFVSGLMSGRGFIALAANIFGGWTVLGAAGAGFIFSYFMSLQRSLQTYGIPSQFISMIPYILTIIVLALSYKRSKAPEAEGEPYDRE